MRRIRTAVGVAAVVVFVVALLGPAASATTPGAIGKIYFSARVDGASNDNEILAIDPGGTGLVNVTPPSTHVAGEPDGDNRDPALTADGSRFVWLTDRCWDAQPTPYCGTHQVGMAAADGSGATRLTDLPSSDQETPAVSPDGTRIAFESDRSGSSEIWIEDLAGGALTQVTHTGQTNTRDPAFSPDGTKLAYDSNGHVWIVDPATGATTDLGGGVQPTWSPDGTQVAFASGRSGASEIWRSRLDGTGAVQLTFLGCNESSPSWSPDGQWIVFHSNCDGGLDVASAVDGSSRHLLIGDHVPYASVGAPELPDWQTAPSAPPPPQPPTVVSTTPPAGAAGVDTGAVVSATFSRAMDPATITAISFTLVGPSGAVAGGVTYDGPSDTATLTPTAPLAAGTAYTATLATAITAADGTALAAPVSWTFTTAAPAPQPPTVVSTSPPDGAPGVAADAVVRATFSRAMDAGTITSSSFTLGGPGGVVAATVAYDAATATAALTPAGPLAGLTTYTATLTTAVTSADGVALAAAATWSFTTAPGPLLVVSTIPADGATRVPLAAAVSVTFNKPLDPSTTLSNLQLIDVTSTPTLVGRPQYTAGSTAVTFGVSGSLEYAHTYQIYVGPFIKAADGGGFPFSGFRATFTTIDAPPTVTSVMPAGGSSGVSAAATVRASFSRAMDGSTITHDSFTLTGPDGPVAAAVVYDAGTNSATLTPNAPLADLTTYTAVLTTAVTAADGIPLAADKLWSFTTAPGPLLVTATTPAGGAVDVALTTPLRIEFNKPLDPSSATVSNLQLADLTAGTLLAGPRYTPGSTTVTFDAAGRLDFGHTYMLYVGPFTKAADGGSFAFSGFRATFTTVPPPPDTTPPAISYTIDGTLGDNGWYTSDVHLVWKVLEPDSPSTLTYAGCDDQTITADQAETAYACVASSAGGTSSAAVAIKRDGTPPLVRYDAHPATYTVDQTVAIGCTTTDATSGIASTTCAPITGPAYSFALGTNTFSATARDWAGNGGSGSASFTVLASPESLAALVGRFVSGQRVVGSLTAKIGAIATAPNARAREGMLGAFDNELAAQAGKSLTAAQAAILERLAAALR